MVGCVTVCRGAGGGERQSAPSHGGVSGEAEGPPWGGCGLVSVRHSRPGGLGDSRLSPTHPLKGQGS